jgi:hypothetical protein
MIVALAITLVYPGNENVLFVVFVNVVGYAILTVSKGIRLSLNLNHIHFIALMLFIAALNIFIF